MAAFNQFHEAMLRRHHPALVRFASISKVPANKLAFILADVHSTFGRVMIASGSIVTDRVSVVMPTMIDAVPALLEAAGHPDVEQLVAHHGAVPVVTIDRDDVAAASFVRVFGGPSGCQQAT